MTLLVPARSQRSELLDRPDNAREDLEAAMRDLELVQRLLGGWRTQRKLLGPHVHAGDQLEILDVGAGGGDLGRRMGRWARRLGCRLRVTAIELDGQTAAIAARRCRGEPDLRVVRGDAFGLPFGDGSFDLVAASLFLHHFTHGRVVRLLTEFRRVARRAVLVNDLRRHRIPWAFVAAAGRLTRRDRMFVHDAPLSVLRGFTATELQRAADESGGTGAAVRRAWPYRLLLTIPASARA